MSTFTSFFQLIVHILDSLNHKCTQVFHINAFVLILMNLELLFSIAR